MTLQNAVRTLLARRRFLATRQAATVLQVCSRSLFLLIGSLHHQELGFMHEALMLHRTLGLLRLQPSPIQQ